MLEILKAILFGVVEGITEWLPISSTGHMILLNSVVKLEVTKSFYEMFEVVIQLGAIMAVVVIFWKKIWPFGKVNNSHQLKKSGIGTWIKKDIFELWLHIMVSCFPAILFVLLHLDEKCDNLFFKPVPVAIALIVFGIAFIVVESKRKNMSTKINSVMDITYTTAFLIGIFQLLAAAFPGTSRSGATIVGALLIGVSRTVAAEYTFYLAIPVMFGASLLKIFKFGFSFSGMEAAILLVGMVVAFIVSMFVIKFLMGYIKKHDFKVFGWYRIVLGIIVLACGIAGLI